jgi:hypothetical protein
MTAVSRLFFRGHEKQNYILRLKLLKLKGGNCNLKQGAKIRGLFAQRDRLTRTVLPGSDMVEKAFVRISHAGAKQNIFVKCLIVLYCFQRPS